MFSSAVLDLAFGLVFCFLSVSLTTGVIVEAIASALALRAKTLRKGIGQLLNDTGYSALAKELYAHALVNPRGDGTRASAQKANKNDPSYIDRQLFAQAMLDVLKISPQIGAAADGKPTVTALTNTVNAALGPSPDPQLQRFLHGVIERSLGDPDKIKAEIAAWFDNSMDRLSGWYKRWTQLASVIIGFVLAAGLNIDAITVAKALWEQPKLVEELKLPATLTTGAGGAAAQAPAPTATPASSGTASPNNASVDAAKMLLHDLNTTLPIGWPHGVLLNKDGSWISWGTFWLALLGWGITAATTVFGAPFWFDALQTVIRLKGSGPSPREKVHDTAAAA